MSEHDDGIAEIERKIEMHDQEEISKLTNWANQPKLEDLKQDYDASKDSHSTHVANVTRWLDNMHMRGSAKLKARKGRSGIQPKTIRKQAEWRYPALSEPFLSTSDIFNAAPMTFEDKASAVQNGLVLNYQFNNVLDKQRFIDDYIHALVDEGTAIIRTGWESKEREITEMAPVYEHVIIEDPAQAQRFQEITAMQENDPSMIDNIPDELMAAFEHFQETGQVNIAHVIGTKEVTYTESVVDKPTAEICEFENTIIDPTAKGDMDNAMFVIRKYTTSYGELKGDSKYQNLDKVNIVNNAAEDADTESSGTADMYSDDSGGVGSFQFADKPRKKITAFEYWGYADIHGEGTLELFTATWVGDTLIHMESDPMPDGKIPFVLVHYLPNRGYNYGEPDGELLEENQKVIGATTRGMIDVMARGANGQQGTRKDALDATQLAKKKRGEDYEYNGNVDPAQAFHMHKFDELPQSASVMLQYMSNDAESLTGIKAFTSGITGNALGDSVGGQKNAMDASSKREMAILRRAAKGIVDMGVKICAMNAAWLGEKQVVRITNSKFIQVKREDLKGNFDLSLSISTPEADDAKAAEIAFMLQTLGNTVDWSIVKMMMVENARLRKMPELAHKLEAYEPKPDPLQVAEQELKIELLRAQIATETAKYQEMGIKGQHEQVKIGETMSKTRLNEAKADETDLNVLEEESGVNQERSIELVKAQSAGNINHEVVKSLLAPKDKPEAKKKPAK